VVLFSLPDGPGGRGGGGLGGGVGAPGGSGGDATGTRPQRPPGGESRRLRRAAAQEELINYFRKAAAAEAHADASGDAGSAAPRDDADAECPICLEPLSAGQARAPCAAPPCKRTHAQPQQTFLR
jgi:hypothetical protein